jgi:hypothetical protein
MCVPDPLSPLSLSRWPRLQAQRSRSAAQLAARALIQFHLGLLSRKPETYSTGVSPVSTRATPALFHEGVPSPRSVGLRRQHTRAAQQALKKRNVKKSR